jgi:hypothetical protein
MARTLLISTAYLKSNSPLNGAVDDNLMRPSIDLAQFKYIKPYLGCALYDKILADVAAQTVTGAYATLLDDYIKPALNWWTLFELVTPLTFKLDNSSIVQRTSEDTTAIDGETIGRLKNDYKNNAEAYMRYLMQYICDNSASFPEYYAAQTGVCCPIKKLDRLSFGFSESNTAMGSDYIRRKFDDPIYKS